MLKTLILNNLKDNGIYKLLTLEYVKEEYLVFINELSFMFNVSDRYLVTLSHEVFYCLMKLFMSNTYKYVVTEDTNMLTHHLAYGLYGNDINVELYHIKNIVDIVAQSVDEDRDYIEKVVTRYIRNYLNNIYRSNPNGYGEEIFKLYQYLYETVGYLKLSSYKFEVMGDKPILIFTEREQYAYPKFV